MYGFNQGLRSRKKVDSPEKPKSILKTSSYGPKVLLNKSILEEIDDKRNTKLFIDVSRGYLENIAISFRRILTSPVNMSLRRPYRSLIKGNILSNKPWIFLVILDHYPLELWDLPYGINVLVVKIPLFHRH